MEIVKKMCATSSIGCRSLNKKEDARKLMDICNVPNNAEIWEIPVDWENQIVIVFELPKDDNYYCLFVGSTNDNNLCFELSIEGKIKNGEVLPYDENEIVILENDYFLK